MATIKSYTDLSQSKTLSKILPLESADMCYSNDGTAIKIDANPYTVRYSMWKDCVAEIIPCWSLATLLSVLDFPSLTQNKEDEWEVCVPNHQSDGYTEVLASNPIDACVAMIEKLHEPNLL